MRRTTLHLLTRMSLVILAACLLMSCPERTDGPAPDFYSEVRATRRLYLARMAVSKMATISDIDIDRSEGPAQTAAAIVDALKIGDRVAAYSYDTYLQAYVDLSALTPSDVITDRADKTVTITLPPVIVETSGRDLKLREDHYRVTGLRSHVSPQERALLKERMSESLAHELESGTSFRDKLIAQARDRATAYFTQLLAPQGYTAIVRFR